LLNVDFTVKLPPPDRSLGSNTDLNTSLFNTSLFDDLEMYVNDIQVGTTALDGEPEVVNETSATALVKGNNLLGPVSSLHQQYLAL